MAYTPINFRNKESGGTPLSANNLNHMEQGIIDAHNLVPTESGTTGQVLTKTATGTAWQDTDAFPSEGTVGQVLTKANEGVQWTDAGNPTDAQVSEAVTDWLDENVQPTTPAVTTNLNPGISGAAADSKAVADELSELKSEINNSVIPLLSDFTDINLWELNTLNGSTGAEATNNKRIRTTGFLSSEIYAVTPSADYPILIYGYDSDNSDEFVGTYNNGVWVKSTSNLQWYTEAVNLKALPANYKIRIVCKYGDGTSTMTKSQGNNIVFSSPTVSMMMTAEGDSWAV